MNDPLFRVLGIAVVIVLSITAWVIIYLIVKWIIYH